MSLQADFELA